MAMDTSRAGGRGRRPSFRGASFSRVSRGVEVLQAWPSSRGKNLHPKTKAQMEYFRQVQWAFKYSSAWVQRSFAESVKGTPLMPRDLFLMAISGRMHRVIDENGKSWWSVAAIKNISDSLDVIAQLPGSMLFRRGDRWAGTTAGEPGFVLTYEDDDTPPSWQPPAAPAGTAWGDITGDLGDQADLEAALNALSAAIGTKAADTIFTALANGLVPAPGPATGRVLLDDGTWAGMTPPVWGHITGALADQADLEAALNALSAAIGTKAANAIFTALANGLVPAPGPATGRVLTDGGTWASIGGVGGLSSLQLLFDDTVPSGTPSVSFGGIPQNFYDLILQCQARSDAAVAATDLQLQINGDTAANYDWKRWNTFGQSGGVNQTWMSAGECAATSVPNNNANTMEITIPGYSQDRWHKRLTGVSNTVVGTDFPSQVPEMIIGNWRSHVPVTSIFLKPAAGSFVDGSTFRLYGRGRAS